MNRRPVPIALIVLLLIAGLGAAQSSRNSQPPRNQRADAPANRFGLSQPKPRPPGTIRVAAYNVLNFFDHVDDPSLQGEFDDIKFGTSDVRCAELAAVIRKIDADVISLEEVESKQAVTWLRDTYLADMGYKYIASQDVGYYRGVEQAVLSRFKITAERIWPDLTLDDVKREGIGWATAPADAPRPLKFQRSPLMVDIETDSGYALTIFAVHHKAGGREQMHHREAEALKIVEMLTELQTKFPARNIIVMGDFNSAPWDKSMRVYLQSGMIDTLAFRTTGGQDPESPLYKTHESDRVLDYILMNGGAYRELVYGSPHVFGTLTPPSSYDYQKDPQPPGYASDHYPVIVDIRPKENP